VVGNCSCQPYERRITKIQIKTKYNKNKTSGTM